MILVDTSVWVDHFRTTDDRLTDLLLDGQVMGHAFVAGELACGNLRRRSEVLTLLTALPQLSTVAGDEVVQFLDLHRLTGNGLGWVDVQLLASVFASREQLWTKDRRLAEAARRLGVGA
jgi:predicted nucleic acid-binding protein